MSCFIHSFEYSHQYLVLFTQMFVKLLLYSNKISSCEKRKKDLNKNNYLLLLSIQSSPLGELSFIQLGARLRQMITPQKNYPGKQAVHKLSIGSPAAHRENWWSSMGLWRIWKAKHVSKCCQDQGWCTHPPPSGAACELLMIRKIA